MTLTADNVILESATCDLEKSQSKVLSSSLKVDKVFAKDLRARYQSDWQRMRRSDARFESPYFSLEFVEAVGGARSDVIILVVKRGDDVVGFLPLQVSSSGHSVPIGGLYNDSHGLLCDSLRDDFSYIDLLKKAGLKSYRFHSMAVVTQETEKFRYGTVRSFLADLDRHPYGYHRFLEETRGTVFKQRRKTKKMVKDLGPLRLVFDSHDLDERQRIIEMKRSQYQRTNIFDILSVPWVHELFARLAGDNADRTGCRLITSALYAGTTLVAGHIGMIERDQLYYWFPAYDQRYHAYSPGTALFLEIASAAAEQGIKKIDFGYGEQPYKLKLTDTVSEMQFGSFDVSRTRWHANKAIHFIKLQRKQLPFRENLKRMLRRFAPNFGAKNY